MAKMSDHPAARLLDWYDRHARNLPWRARDGVVPDPYHVWLSEIMLQQTTVASVKGYFEDFLARWPTVLDLARAELDEVLHAWQGLGYYARARNLHKCARMVADELGGVFPDTEEGFLALPGIGPYTAAAIAAIAFDRAAMPVDGNIARVMARLHRVKTPMPKAKPELIELAKGMLPPARYGDFAQAVMDLGATICTPRNPMCALCPWREICKGAARGDAADYPVREKKAERPTRSGIIFWLVDRQGRVLLRRRPEQGLLGGMMEFPTGDWREGAWNSDDLEAAAPVRADWKLLEGRVRHTFTHFHLELTVFAGEAGDDMAPEGVWAPIDQLGDHALPTVMKKVAKHALAHL
jgi:A/G-specific adenine glycosylase